MKNKKTKAALAIVLFFVNGTLLYNCINSQVDKHLYAKKEYGTYEMIDGDFYVKFSIYKEDENILCLSEYGSGQKTIDTLYMSKFVMHNKPGLKFEYSNGYNKEYYFIPDNTDLCYLVNSANKVFYISNKIE